MTKTFESECKRKDKLFEAWESFLHKTRTRLEAELPEDTQFERVIDGLVHVSVVSKNRIELTLESGERIKNVHVPAEVTQHMSPDDKMHVILGKLDHRWQTLEVVSIGSMIGSNGLHMTMNPALMRPPSNENLH